MRRIVYAASFVEDAARIGEYIEAQFGIARADAFTLDINRFCELVAEYPGLGRRNHGYETVLYGVVHNRNWIFFEHDEVEIRFVRLVEGVRHKPATKF